MASRYEIAEVIAGIDGVDDVRVSKRQLTVAYAPDERHVEDIPEEMRETILRVLDDTMWEEEYNDGGVERHSWSNGRSHDPILNSYDQPAGYELQYHFIR
jgi:hypothetical protein